MFRTQIDLGFFVAYLVFNIAIGLWVSRRKMRDAREYFLAGDGLPWYAIGGSIIAANISTEHFIGMVGAAYASGIILAQWEWGNWLTFSALLWVFLPYYLRGGVYTMPEFLERRYNTTCRYIFAVCSLTLWIVAQMAVVMLAGAKALEGMFGFNPYVTIIGLAILTGSYTIYGGLRAVAWTDFLQFLILMLGGAIVTILSLRQVGGIGVLMHALPQKFVLVYPATDKQFPWVGVYTLFISIGIWYNCTNQFIVQRCLGARSEWDSRMGVVFAGFMKIILPFLVVIPGIVAFRLFPKMSDPDQAYPHLVKEFIPAGLAGIVMAGLASALMSHLSSVLNSSSTVFTIDIYQPIFCRNTSGEDLVWVGRLSAFLILIVATLLAFWFTRGQATVFLLIQNVGAWVAAPISVVFLAGVLWKRATAWAATFVLLFGFPYTWFVEYILFKHVSGFAPYDNWLNRTFVVWATCVVVMVIASLVTRAPEANKIQAITWSWETAGLPKSEQARNRGLRNITLWWGTFVGIIFILYGYLIWFQFWRR